MTEPSASDRHSVHLPLRTPDLESLRLLVLVADLGSLGRAAERLRISQPSASRRLSTLERGLGLVLLDRTRRGSRLTLAGQVVTGHARSVLAELDDLLTGAGKLRDRREAELRVAASLTIAEYLLPTWISELRSRRPELYIGLQVTNSEHVPELVEAGEADIGFIEGPRLSRVMSTRQVAEDRLVVVVDPGHPWARRREPLSARELSRTPLVLRESGSGTRQTLDRALHLAGCDRARPLVELGSTAAVRGAVIAGTGPSVLSELAVRGDIVEGRLTGVEVAGVDLTRDLRAVWPTGRRLVGPAAELVAVARREVAV
ncbi:LysR family transcriptional regulator [Streptomyces noursei ZPM]|nr:LysR substrate-binding domain-containing protein [Streptomyces noursei]AKA08132.1 LysR family transcriptional regulator [Streptomyces noursei ZPM]EOT00562.1 LysR family transcriptional regulator [Streptomyces noursei CCRC 11814]MCZ0974664.1 LysR substrate-binding domain-containing protein [Streptomyces noursei]UWS76767.1 LysR substrate-binding domain-containing protein [Streptomyces noursei]